MINNFNKMNKEIEYRMYGFVPYQLSDKQKMIQFGHAVVEYGLPAYLGKTSEYTKWSNVDKTFIVLDGGTTNDTPGRYYGTLQQYMQELRNNGVDIAEFRELDLNNCLTAVVFLAPEGVWKKKPYYDNDNYYPNFRDYLKEKGFDFGNGPECSEERIIKDFPENYEKWIELIGGKRNLFLRNFLSNKKLA